MATEGTSAWNEGMVGAPGWGDAGIITPWTSCLQYGDTRLSENTGMRCSDGLNSKPQSEFPAQERRRSQLRRLVGARRAYQQGSARNRLLGSHREHDVGNGESDRQ